MLWTPEQKNTIDHFIQELKDIISCFLCCSVVNIRYLFLCERFNA